MKIISGKYKGKKLISLSKETRPTSSFVIEAVFNMLGYHEGIILDLFAGSGSYGFEALSRGANKLYLNDLNKDAYKSLQANKKTVNAIEEVVVSNLDYKEALLSYKKSNIYFEIAFIDPPYNFSDEEILNILTELTKMTRVIVLEREKNSSIIEISDKEIIKNKNYGIKQIIIYE